MTPTPTPTEADIEALAIRQWVRQMAHSDSPQSVSAARRRWDRTSEDVRQSWRRQAAGDIEEVDAVRAKNKTVPSYMEQCDSFQIADHIEWGDALYRFKENGVEG